MRVEFKFNSARIEQDGYYLADVHHTVKKVFNSCNLPCVSDSENLVFAGTGKKDDYANMRSCIMELLTSDWFLQYCSSCLYSDSDIKEDILSQAWKVKSSA